MSILVIAAILLVLYLLFFSNDSVVSNYDEKKKTKKQKKVKGVSSYENNFEEYQEDTSDDIVDSKCPGFVSSDLLPKVDQQDGDFGEFAPSNAEGNFLDSSKFLSMQTSLLRNSNLQIRPDPEIPRENVCPWNNSTIFRENTESSALKKSEEF